MRGKARAQTCAHLFAFDVFFAGWFLGYPGNAMADVLSYDRFALTPPPIYELTFSVRSGDHAPDFYFLRSQGSNYVVRSATSAARLRATVSQMGAEDICYGLCDGEFWSVRMFQFRPLYLRGKQATEGTNQLSFMVEALHRLCVVPLHLGLYDVDVPRAFWRGDTFHYASLTPARRTRAVPVPLPGHLYDLQRDPRCLVHPRSHQLVHQSLHPMSLETLAWRETGSTVRRLGTIADVRHTDRTVHR